MVWGSLTARRVLMRILAATLLFVATLGGFVWCLRNSLFDSSLPTVRAANPTSGEFGVPVSTSVRITFRKAMRSRTVSSSTFSLRDSDDRIVPAVVSYQPDTRTALLKPVAPLTHSAAYRVSVDGGPSGVLDKRGNGLEKDLSWSFTTGSPSPTSLSEGPGGPILVVTSRANPFSAYYTEILRNEGFNEFASADISSLSATTLKQYDLAILGEFPLSEEQVAMLTEWVRSGGNLIAMRPSKNLARQAGLKDTGEVRRDGYVSINTSEAPGLGLVKETLQFHGPADLYDPNGATELATLYSNATTSTGSPAVTLERLGSGFMAIFVFDLARSVVYTRQGNPIWSAMERDGIPPIRSDDLFYGAASFDPEPDWIDLNKIAIPQADEQQRFLANLILQMNFRKKPLPRFWYFPGGFKAVVIMTGDDHGHGGTLGRFIILQAKDPPNCVVAEWQCVRGTSNIFVGTIQPSQAAALSAEGFEIGLHLKTGCADFPWKTSPDSASTLRRQVSWKAADFLYSRQLAQFAAAYPGVPPPRTTRVDCVNWGDYDTQPQVELKHGIRLDTNYYYWPPKWVGNRPGMFTGSGMPMRFAKLDGSLIDVYQAATQMTDESGQTYPFTIDSLLSKALGAEEYYGAFTVNMHTDNAESAGADAIVAAAQARGVPIVAANQMLTWLDGRNGSSFQNIAWNGKDLEFTVLVGQGGNGIWTMIPMNSNGGVLTQIDRDGRSVTYTKRTVAGEEYAEFLSPPGAYVAIFSSRTSALHKRRQTKPKLCIEQSGSPGCGADGGTNLTGALMESSSPLTANRGRSLHPHR